MMISKIGIMEHQPYQNMEHLICVFMFLMYSRTHKLRLQLQRSLHHATESFLLSCLLDRSSADGDEPCGATQARGEQWPWQHNATYGLAERNSNGWGASKRQHQFAKKKIYI